MGVSYGPKITFETLNIYSTSTVTVTSNAGSSYGTIFNIFKTGGSSGWDAQAYSLTGFTAPCTIQFKKDADVTDNGLSYSMIGWNEDPTNNASYDTLDHAAYPYRTDNYSVYNNGTNTLYGTAWDKTKNFYLVYDSDGYIRHYNGSTLLYSANYGTGKTVYLDSSYYIAGSYTTNGFTNIAVVKKSWNGQKYV